MPKPESVTLAKEEGNVLKPLLGAVDFISDWSGKITSFLILLIIGYILYGASVRHWFHGIYNHIGISQSLFTIYASLGAAYAFQNKAFINIDIFYRRFSVRNRAIIDSVTFILTILFLATLLQYTTKVALEALPNTHFAFKMLLPNNWPTTLILPVGVWLLALQGLSKFIRDLITAITGKEIA